MQFKQLALAASLLATGLAAQAQTEIQWWHSMTAVNNEWVNDLARDFNASQKDYKVVPTFKGNYDESMTAAIAAFRSGNAPHILQVFEVGTATMMASKGATVPGCRCAMWPKKAACWWAFMKSAQPSLPTCANAISCRNGFRRCWFRCAS